MIQTRLHVIVVGVGGDLVHFHTQIDVVVSVEHSDDFGGPEMK